VNREFRHNAAHRNVDKTLPPAPDHHAQSTWPKFAEQRRTLVIGLGRASCCQQTMSARNCGTRILAWCQVSKMC
jgi:hypothetical protein